MLLAKYSYFYERFNQLIISCLRIISEILFLRKVKFFLERMVYFLNFPHGKFFQFDV